MSVKRSTKETGASSRQIAGAFYVYCVGEGDTLAPLLEGDLPAPIETPSSLEMIRGDGLAAITSAVPISDYGEQELQARLTDATWTAVRAMRHEGVVEYFARRAGVVPLRFGTIYLRRESVQKMLAERDAQFRRIIERLRGREEWGVNVYTDRAKLKAGIDGASPVLREMTERAATVTPGQAYLLRKKIETMRGDEARVAIKRVAVEVENELASVSEGAARLRVLKDEASEHGDLTVKLAFLVRCDLFDKFRAAAERLAEAHAPLGFRLELTGPWPAYNFANEEEKDAERAHGKA
jgi:hypothetical protein